MPPTDSIFPSKKSILDMMQNILVEPIDDDENVSEIEDNNEVFNNLEILSEIASTVSYIGDMEQYELSNDNVLNISPIYSPNYQLPNISYQQLLCFEDMEASDDEQMVETSPNRSTTDGVFEGLSLRPQSYFWDSSSLSSDDEEHCVSNISPTYFPN